MRVVVAVIALSLSACVCAEFPLEGRACNAEHPCPGELSCVDSICVSGTVVDTTCRLFDSEQIFACPRRHFFVTPDGGDGADGLTVATAWATLDHPLRGGDVVHLEPGTYAHPQLIENVMNTGQRTCPIEVSGPLDGGLAIIQSPVSLNGDFWWLHDLEFRARVGVRVNFADGIRLERLKFRNTLNSSSDRDIYAVGSESLEIIECDVVAEESEMLLVSFGSVSIRQSRFDSRTGGRFQVPANTTFIGNDVTGAFLSGRVLDVEPFDDGGVSVFVSRNVFHDLRDEGGGNLVVVSAGTRVEGNTFINVARGTASASGVFRDNIVSQLDVGSRSSAGAGFNLFDSDVLRPYADGGLAMGDVVAAPMLGVDFIPLEASPAIDSASPERPVPPGGGSRADIGAFERGATRLRDGRYCVDGGGW